MEDQEEYAKKIHGIDSDEKAEFLLDKAHF